MQVVSDECFTIAIFSIIIVTIIVSPLVKALYDPSKRYLAYKRRTIKHLREKEEFRILACVHIQEHVQGIITLLASLDPDKKNPIRLLVLHLVKLSARVSSLLIAYPPQENRTLTRDPSQSERIFDAFSMFQQQYPTHFTLQCYKGISPYATMHNDVCSLALKQRTSLIIIPFKSVYRHLNNKVLEKAPCSVGVLVDLRSKDNFIYVIGEDTIFHVAVLFFGGPDDREALAYAKHMVKKPFVVVTLFRFTFYDQGFSRSKVYDDEILTEFRQATMDKERFSCEERVVEDVDGFRDVIKSLDNAYNLVMVGKNHEELELSEVKKWKDKGELGAIGEMFAASDFKEGFYVLVLQQQKRVWGLRDPEETLLLT